MGEKTKIQWTDLTWNVAVGCDKVDGDCKFCYMYRQSLNGTRYLPNQVIKTKTVFTLPLQYKGTKSECWDGNPLIFTSSLTDFFHEDIDGFRDECWDIIRKCPHLTFQILTKRPERITACLPPDWGEGWDNVWLGTSVGSKQGLNRIAELCYVPAKTRFLSIEPLWEGFTLQPIEAPDHDPVGASRIWPLQGRRTDMGRPCQDTGKIHWVIVGGESGNDTGKYQYRECQLSWIEDIVYVCRNNKIPVFVKQVGTYLAKKLKMSDRHGGNFDEFPASIKYREFPKP